MRASQLIVCFCLAGFTHLVWSQNKSAAPVQGTQRPLPQAGRDNTQARSGTVQPMSGTPILFREIFDFSIYTPALRRSSRLIQLRTTRRAILQQRRVAG